MTTKEFTISKERDVELLVLNFSEDQRIVDYKFFLDGEEITSLHDISEIVEYGGLANEYPDSFTSIYTPQESDMYDGKSYVVHVVYKPTMQAIGVSGTYTSYDGCDPYEKIIADIGEKTINILENTKAV